MEIYILSNGNIYILSDGDINLFQSAIGRRLETNPSIRFGLLSGLTGI